MLRQAVDRQGRANGHLHDRAGPGLIALAMRNAYYDSEQAYLDALAAALASNMPRSSRLASVLQIDSPDLGMERSRTYRDRPLVGFSRLRGARRRGDQSARSETSRRRRCACMSAGANRRDRTTRMCRCKDIIRALAGGRVGAWVLPFANPGMPMNIGYLNKLLVGRAKDRGRRDRHHDQLHRTP